MHANEDIWGIGLIKEPMRTELAVTRAARVRSPNRTMTSTATVPVISPDRGMRTRAAKISNWRMASRGIMMRTTFMKMSDRRVEG